MIRSPVKHLSLLLALALAACEPTGQVATDGYLFETAQEKLSQRQITVTLHATREDLVRSHPDVVEVQGSKIQAYATYSPNGDRCWIHIVDPAKGYQPEFYGHELTHCLYGRWHPTQP